MIAINNYKYYNWLIFYDIDEFIYLKNYSNIKIFLNEKKFKKCNIIHLNWVIHSDNNQLFYYNKTLKERFPKIMLKKNLSVKSILRGNIPNIKFNNMHIINSKYESCNGFGKKIHLFNNYLNPPDLKYYYINHYYYKSTEEFITKIKRGSCYTGASKNTKILRLISYLFYNSINQEKIKLFENKIGFNLKKINFSEFKKNKKDLLFKYNTILNKYKLIYQNKNKL